MVFIKKWISEEFTFNFWVKFLNQILLIFWANSGLLRPLPLKTRGLRKYKPKMAYWQGFGFSPFQFLYITFSFLSTSLNFNLSPSGKNFELLRHVIRDLIHDNSVSKRELTLCPPQASSLMKINHR
jgi:hypothetical protein